MRVRRIAFTWQPDGGRPRDSGRDGEQTMADEELVRHLSSGTTRRTIVKTGAKLAYVAPVVAASFTISNLDAAAQGASPGCVGGGRCTVDDDCCGGETCVGGICSVEACEGAACGSFTQCHPTADCQCYTAAEGAGVCGCNTFCSEAPPCTTSGDCAADRFCAVNSCCGAAGVCLPICTSASTCQLGLNANDVGGTSSGH